MQSNKKLYIAFLVAVLFCAILIAVFYFSPSTSRTKKQENNITDYHVTLQDNVVLIQNKTTGELQTLTSEDVGFPYLEATLSPNKKFVFLFAPAFAHFIDGEIAHGAVYDIQEKKKYPLSIQPISSSVYGWLPDGRLRLFGNCTPSGELCDVFESQGSVEPWNIVSVIQNAPVSLYFETKAPDTLASIDAPPGLTCKGDVAPMPDIPEGGDYQWGPDEMLTKIASKDGKWTACHYYTEQGALLILENSAARFAFPGIPWAFSPDGQYLVMSARFTPSSCGTTITSMYLLPLPYARNAFRTTYGPSDLFAACQYQEYDVQPQSETIEWVDQRTMKYARGSGSYLFDLRKNNIQKVK